MRKDGFPIKDVGNNEKKREAKEMQIPLTPFAKGGI